MLIERTENIYSIDVKDEDFAKMFANFLEWEHWELSEIISEWLYSDWGFTRGEIADVFADMVIDIQEAFYKWASKNDVELIDNPMTAKNVKWLKEYKKIKNFSKTY